MEHRLGQSSLQMKKKTIADKNGFLQAVDDWQEQLENHEQKSEF